MTPRFGRVCLRALVAAVFASLAVGPSVSAHAEVVTADPAQGAFVTGPVTQIAVTYSEALTADSRLGIIDPNGNRIAVGMPDPADDHRMVATLSPPIQSGGPYTVRSTSISAEDGDVDRQQWTFSLPVSGPVPATPQLSPTAAPSARATSTAAPSTSPIAPTPTPSVRPDADSTSGSDVILPIIAALAIVAIGGSLLLGRGRGNGTRIGR